MRSTTQHGLSAAAATAALALVWTAGAIAQPLPKGSPESVGMSTERLGRLTTVFQQEVADSLVQRGMSLNG